MTHYWEKGMGNDVPLAERLYLHQLALLVKARFEKPTIVNIGVNRGTSLHPLAASGCRVLAIDTNFRVDIFGKDKLKGVEYFEANSTTFRAQDFSYHLVFVDGGHDYPIVKDDLFNWGRWIPENGIIAVHDYYTDDKPEKHQERLAGVKRAVDEYFVLRKGTPWAWLGGAGSIVAYERVTF